MFLFKSLRFCSTILPLPLLSQQLQKPQFSHNKVQPPELCVQTSDFITVHFGFSTSQPLPDSLSEKGGKKSEGETASSILWGQLMVHIGSYERTARTSHFHSSVIKKLSSARSGHETGALMSKRQWMLNSFDVGARLCLIFFFSSSRLPLHLFIYLFVRLFSIAGLGHSQIKGLAAQRLRFVWQEHLQPIVPVDPLHTQTKTDRLETSHLISTGSTAFDCGKAIMYSTGVRRSYFTEGGEKSERASERARERKQIFSEG